MAFSVSHCAIRTRLRPEEEYFGDIKDEKIPKDMLDLARPFCW